MAPSDFRTNLTSWWTKFMFWMGLVIVALNFVMLTTIRHLPPFPDQRTLMGLLLWNILMGATASLAAYLRERKRNPPRLR